MLVLPDRAVVASMLPSQLLAVEVLRPPLESTSAKPIRVGEVQEAVMSGDTVGERLREPPAFPPQAPLGEFRHLRKRLVAL